MQHALSRALLLALLVGAETAVAQQPNVSAEASSNAAAEPTRIVLVASPGMDELANRFVAELRSLRFDVVRAPDAAVAPTTAELEALAVTQQARAAVRVEAVESSVDVWLVNPQSHEVIYRRVVSDKDPAVAVLRSLEILRGGLVDLQALRPEPEPEPQRPQPPPQIPVPAKRDVVAARPFSAWSFGLGGAVLLPHAGNAASGDAALGVHYRLNQHFALHADGYIPLSHFEVKGTGGSADLYLGGLLLAATVSPLGERAVTPSLGLGVGSLMVYALGHASDGFRALNTSAFATLPHARAGLGFRLAPRLWLTTGLTAGLATPRPVLVLADQRNSNWLNPLLIATLAIEGRAR